MNNIIMQAAIYAAETTEKIKFEFTKENVAGCLISFALGAFVTEILIEKNKKGKNGRKKRNS